MIVVDVVSLNRIIPFQLVSNKLLIRNTRSQMGEYGQSTGVWKGVMNTAYDAQTMPSIQPIMQLQLNPSSRSGVDKHHYTSSITIIVQVSVFGLTVNTSCSNVCVCGRKSLATHNRFSLFTIVSWWMVYSCMYCFTHTRAVDGGMAV
jgi:hypothetical protein